MKRIIGGRYVRGPLRKIIRVEGIASNFSLMSLFGGMAQKDEFAGESRHFTESK